MVPLLLLLPMLWGFYLSHHFAYAAIHGEMAIGQLPFPQPSL